jgi:hypothetical protein
VSGGSVEVDVQSLWNYGIKQLEDVSAQIANIAEPMTHIADDALMAFTQAPATLSGGFAEGQTAMAYTMRNFHDFHNFIGDVTAGAQAMQAASMTMAVAYATADGDSVNSINAVDFAFADGGKPLKGFPTKDAATLYDLQQAAEDARGANTMATTAATDPDALKYATNAVATRNGWLYTFGDGSTLRVDSQTTANPFASGTQKTYTVTDATHPALRRTTSAFEYRDNSNGDQTTTKTEDIVAADGTHTASSTSFTTHVDHSVDTTVTSTDSTGKQTVTPPVHTPPVADKGPAPAQDGIPKREQDLGTSGDPRNQVIYGT